MIEPVECEPYRCAGCSERTGYRVVVKLRPCVMCAAVRHAEAEAGEQEAIEAVKGLTQ